VHMELDGTVTLLVGWLLVIGGHFHELWLYDVSEAYSYY